MIGYKAFAELALSSDSDERGRAAYLAALAYLNHKGPAAEHAALYAALVGFLDDSSVKVRAALAYGLLHSPDAPRPVILSLLQDSGVIARAVLQYSPVLVDADLFDIVARADASALLAIAQRSAISSRLAAALIARADHALILRLIRRKDVAIPPAVLDSLAAGTEDDAQMRGALLARQDLPATARLLLVRQVTESLQACRLVKGSLTSDRLGKLLRDGADAAVAAIGEAEAGPSREDFIESLVENNQLTTRLLLHSVVTGRVMFFASCVAGLANTGSSKVFTLLESGNRASLTALFARCGLSVAANGLMVRLVLLARTADLADDVAARHYVINALTEELITEHSGNIPEELEEVFGYLNEQNIALARKAARGVMAAFARTTEAAMALPPASMPEMAQLSAA
jgi:Uncharacterized protein conserved in bacteria